MNKKDVLITIGICAIGWAAFPIILKLVENRRKKEGENEKRIQTTKVAEKDNK